MLTFIANNIKSICFRSMILFCWKSTLHRRRSYYYILYATVLIIFSLLVIIWFLILTQLSTTFNDSNQLSKSLSFDSSGAGKSYQFLYYNFISKLIQKPIREILPKISWVLKRMRLDSSLGELKSGIATGGV